MALARPAMPAGFWRPWADTGLEQIDYLVDEQPATMQIERFVPQARSPGSPAAGQAYWIRMWARGDGSFTVTHTRNSFSKTYAATA